MGGINKLGKSLDHAHVAHNQQAHGQKNTRKTAQAQPKAPAARASAGAGSAPSHNVAAKAGIDASLQKAKLNALLAAPAQASRAARTAAKISTPAQRHDGSNKYDSKPVTDRRAGDPDRYRSVNPAVVKRQDGRYFFPAKVKAGTHYFDKDHRTRGTVTGADVKVDVTRTRMMTGADGKKRKYVLAQGLGYVRAGALTSSLKELKKDLKDGPAFKFELKPGPHQLYDTFGKDRGTLGSASVKLNFGQEIVIKGEKYYYAFATKLTDGTPVSGYIKASALKVQPYPLKPGDVSKVRPAPGSGPFDTTFNITGGDPQALGPDGKHRFGYMGEVNGKRQFISYKVLPGVSLAENKNVAATDYLRRSDNVVNMGFNVAGLSNDTFKVDGDARLVFHHNSKDKDAAVKIPLYHPQDADHAGKKPVGYMTFVYGYVDTQSGRRWGWMALDALAKQTP